MPAPPASKTAAGRFFEDFRLGQTICHPTPRTLTSGDASLYSALTGGRFAPQSAETFARAIGYPQSPVDDLLAFHVVFGKTVSDVSLNAVANLGYADCRFLKPVFSGDTLSAVSQVIGLKENSNRQSGVVHVRSQGFNQRGETVIDYVRWVMVRKRDPAAPAPEAHVPKLPEAVGVANLGAACPPIDRAAFDEQLSGSPHRFEDYGAGERIDHVDGVTVEEAEHQTATRLYQNAARVHFNQFSEGQGRFGRRLVYGGHVISLARALSFNGLANAFHIAAINGGRHVAPLFAGDTVFAWSEVIETAALPYRDDVGGLEAAHNSDQEPPLRRLSLARGRGLRAPCRARARLLGACAATDLSAMRLPADAVLIIVEAQESIDPRLVAGHASAADENIAALVAAWRAEGLPLAHVGRRPPALSHAPPDGEILVAGDATSAFVGTALEAGLDELGATTLVICGALATQALEASARHAADLGYQVFVVADACRPADALDLNGRLWPAEDVRALVLARLSEAAAIVDAATALRAAATAKARQRRAAGKG